jgi:uncharacterized protein YyaL (SSP411 family)
MKCRSTMRRTLTVTVLLASAALATGCGGFTMTDDAAAELALQVQEVRTAAGSGDRSVAESALAELRATVDRLRTSDDLADDRASVILAAASDVEQALDVMPTTTTTLPPIDEDEGPGHGKGKGHDKEDED